MNSRSIDYRSAIQSQYSKLGAKKQRIADFVLTEPHKVIAMSVQLLAQ
jgi:DNA-binding MurR/RpiR family transcriptional regulator